MNSKRKEDGSAGTTPIQRAAAESIRWGGRDGRSCTLPPLAKKQLIGLHFHSALLIRRASRPDFAEFFYGSLSQGPSFFILVAGSVIL